MSAVYSARWAAATKEVFAAMGVSPNEGAVSSVLPLDEGDASTALGGWDAFLAYRKANKTLSGAHPQSNVQRNPAAPATVVQKNASCRNALISNVVLPYRRRERGEMSAKQGRNPTQGSVEQGAVADGSAEQGSFAVSAAVQFNPCPTLHGSEAALDTGASANLACISSLRGHNVFLR